MEFSILISACPSFFQNTFSDTAIGYAKPQTSVRIGAVNKDN
ncbi:hypothetical protein HMPREF0322_01388 [Desulfitobacterium hafniense DP7]|uniref:Uncharacterized protein n=1 Tax=Desulfitobacterium hafniense DP7 TaxID=537010 RepID=G9XKA6_DESHA|nr:hypothetical protein HMPREF0322_01388 [Desulfitobacterium hafniense DP7]